MLLNEKLFRSRRDPFRHWSGTRWFLLAMLGMEACMPSSPSLDDEDAGGPSPSEAPGSSDDMTPTPPYEGPWEDPVVVLDSYDGDPFAEFLEVGTWDDWIMFCSGVKGLLLYDASDPSHLTYLDTVKFSEGDPATPRCQHLAVDAEGARIYVSSHADQIQPDSFLSVIDARDPRALEELSAHVLPENVEGLTVHNDLLLVAAHDAGLLVFERGEGGTLNELGRLSGLGNAWTVLAQGDLAYVTDGNGGLAVVDISDPAQPSAVSALELPGATKSLFLDDDRAILAVGSSGVALVSLEDPRAPRLIETEDTPGSAVAVAHGAGPNAVYVADWNDIRVFDFSDRNDLRLIGHEPLPLTQSQDSRTLGIAGRDAVIFSSNWTEFVSYEYCPDCVAPDLVLSPSSLSLASAEPGDATDGAVLMANQGTRPLRIDGVETTEGLTVEEWPARLEAGEEALLFVSFHPADSEPFVGQVTIRSDDPDEGALSFEVLANGGGLGVGDSVTDLVFLGRDGSIVRMEDLLGQVVLLDYFATF